MGILPAPGCFPVSISSRLPVFSVWRPLDLQELCSYKKRFKKAETISDPKMILDTFLDSDGIMGLSHPFWIVTALWGCLTPFHVQQLWDVLLTKCVCDRVLKKSFPQNGVCISVDVFCKVEFEIFCVGMRVIYIHCNSTQ